MFKNKTKKRKVITDKTAEKDTVVFMTAYDIHKIKHHFFHFGKKKKATGLLSHFHIAGFSYKNTYVTPYGNCHYTVEYNPLNQIVAFHFDEKIEEYNKKHENFADEIITTLCLHHSAEAVLDTSLIQVTSCFNMERFLVKFGGKTYQVDPLAFIMNGSLIVNFELIDFETGIPIKADSIFGRINNYGIKPVEKIKYFDESDFKNDNRKISDIIFENIYGFMTKSSNDKWEIGNFSFVHNILVVSNKINNVNEYFQNVLGGKIDNLNSRNLSATSEFEFYSTEYLGVITNIRITENKHHVLNDCIMLESFKTFILLKMIMDYEIHHKLDEIVDHQIYIESLLYPMSVPIITFNFIDNLKNTYSFSRDKEAIDFKLKTLHHYQERKISKNGRLLNILLYILAMLGSAQTLQVLQTEFGLPFKTSFWVVTGIFIILGVIWIVREHSKK